MRYISANEYMKKVFGRKIYKISINGGFTCPNRDGTIGTRGCIFCSGYGSGDFSEDAAFTVKEQIERAEKRVESKGPQAYIAYFQAFTNTYAPVEKLRKLFKEALDHPDIVGISIATRPDCLPVDVVDLLEEMNRVKPVWVELGLQTIHKKSSDYIRRGYELSVYKDGVERLRGKVSHIITHVILGLPGETEADMLETVRYVAGLREEDDSPEAQFRYGIKLQLLHVIRGTDLEKEYEAGHFRCMSMDDYIAVVDKCIDLIPKDMVIHRLTGDGAKKTLVAPLWSGDKKKVLNAMNKIINART